MHTPENNSRELPWEVERYELTESAALMFNRRAFFQRMGAGLLVLLWIESIFSQESGGSGRGRGGGRPSDLGAWLHIGEDDSVSVFTGKAEVGQNIRTS